MKASLLFCGLFLFGLTSAHADLYQWTDAQGVIHVVDDTGAIPESYREKIKTYRASKPTSTPTSLLAPSRTYPAKSQGRFAQKLALDLGLIKSSREDALSPLSAVGIQPAGSWRLSDPLTSEEQAEVVAAARRAADSQRIPLSADGAEAIVQQVGNDFLPPSPLPASPPVEHYSTQEGAPTIIIEQQPPQVIEVIREPVYVPPPVIIVPPHTHGHGGDWHRDHQPQPPRVTNVPLGQFPTFAAPPPTHMPFGASHMPFGTNPAPFGTNR
jgi:hypothetical protein